MATLTVDREPTSLQPVEEVDSPQPEEPEMTDAQAWEYLKREYKAFDALKARIRLDEELAKSKKRRPISKEEEEEALWILRNTRRNVDPETEKQLGPVTLKGIKVFNAPELPVQKEVLPVQNPLDRVRERGTSVLSGVKRALTGVPVRVLRKAHFAMQSATMR